MYSTDPITVDTQPQPLAIALVADIAGGESQAAQREEAKLAGIRAAQVY